MHAKDHDNKLIFDAVSEQIGEESHKDLDQDNGADKAM